MKYTINISGWGSELSAGKIPEKIYEYMRDKFNLDIDAYKDAAEAGEVPDEFNMLADDMNWWDYTEYCQATGPDLYKSDVTVTDEDGEEVFTSKSYDLEYDSDGDDVEIPNDAMLYYTEDKSSNFLVADLECDKFDASKLTLHFTYAYTPEDVHEFHIITKILYDGKELETDLPGAENKGVNLIMVDD